MPATPVLKAAVVALVMAGASSLVSVKLCDVVPAVLVAVIVIG